MQETNVVHILQFRSTHEYYRTTKHEAHPTIGYDKIVNLVLRRWVSVHLIPNRGVGMNLLFNPRVLNLVEHEVNLQRGVATSFAETLSLPRRLRNDQTCLIQSAFRFAQSIAVRTSNV